jgi:uncharacterized glyoxalase superfamily protein PhnB
VTSTDALDFYRSAPVLLVRDVVAAAKHYEIKLGFRIQGFWGEPPGFSIVGRGGVTVMLNQAPAGETFRPNGDYDGRLSAYIYISDADALHAELVQRGAEMICPPEDQPYGCREFEIRDLDGHILAFGQDLL